MKRKQLMRLVAVGLLVSSGSNLVSRFIFPMNDFVLGCFNGIGFGLIILALYRLRFKATY